MEDTGHPPGATIRARPPRDRTWRADLILYTCSALFAGFTVSVTLMPSHRAWATVAVWGYLSAALATVVRAAAGPRWRASRVTAARTTVTATTIGTTLVLPLLILVHQRATGQAGRAQEEVPVIEAAGRRLLDLGTPYLDRDTIAALPDSLRILAYLPYQPAMAVLGIPHALRPTAWWSDVRLAFLLVSAIAIAFALIRLRLPLSSPRVHLALQSVTVLPLCALALATGGDDVPVLALILLALALCATRRPVTGGIAIGLAASLKLVALPIVAVLGAYVLLRQRRAALRFMIGAGGLPLLALAPALVLDVDSVVENVLRFPLGHALVTSPAASPLPGHLLATGVYGGRQLTIALLVATSAAFGVLLVRRPPRTITQVATISGLGLLLAILLLPATRFGYLMYPVALLAWAPALRSGEVHD